MVEARPHRRSKELRTTTQLPTHGPSVSILTINDNPITHQDLQALPIMRVIGEVHESLKRHDAKEKARQNNADLHGRNTRHNFERHGEWVLQVLIVQAESSIKNWREDIAPRKGSVGISKNSISQKPFEAATEWKRQW